MMRCPNECGKKWRIGKWTKPEWKKQEEQEEKKKRRKPTVEEVRMIERRMEEKEEEEEDLIELKVTEEMVP